MTEKDIFDLRAEPGEMRVSCTFRKRVLPKGDEGSMAVILRCKGGEKAVTKLIDILNKALPGDE